MDNSQIFIVGANGQLGTALRQKYPEARFADVSELDITDKKSVENFDWSGIKYILNAAAYTNVDQAETPDGRMAAWAVNTDAVANLVAIAAHYDATLVHISSEYVFDGRQEIHTEDEAFTPVSSYGASKAAGDIAVSLAPRFYILRITWLIGEGKNFVRTMLEIGKKGIEPTVVNDQVGRLTFTSELVRGIDHLLTTEAPYGTYNFSGSGESASWAEIAREIFKSASLTNKVLETTTAEYYQGKEGVAPRPLQSTLDLAKITATGFTPRDWREDLKQYIQEQ